jgi:Zn-dependent protease with chaperone function
MKFVPRDLKESADASAGEGSQSRELVKLSLIALAVIVVLYCLIAVGVDLAVANISVETEKKLFAKLNFARFSAEVSEKPALERVSAVLEKLARNPAVPALDYRPFIIKNETPNALAFPGGPIGVTTGLLEALDDEISLAFVLGHELGHFKNRDHLRGLGRGIATSIVFSLLFGNSLGGDFIAGNISQLMGRAYSRDQEEKADEFGVKLVIECYGSAEGAERLFEIISKDAKIPKWGYMFATHPDTEKRIIALKKYAEKIISEKQTGTE